MSGPLIRTTWRFSLAKALFARGMSLAPATKLPFLGPWFYEKFSSGDEGRVIPIDRSIEGWENTVLPSRAVRQAVEAASHRFLMDRCLCRAAEKCESYPKELGCIFLGEGTKSISPRLGRMVGVNEAMEHLEKCREAGLVHVMGHFLFDALFLDAKPRNRLLSICSCCECCCIFRAYPKMYGPIDRTLKKLDGVSVSISGDCTGCGACEEACFAGAIRVEGDRAVISEACRGCGRCVTLCPSQALGLEIAGHALPEGLLERIA